MVSIHEVGLTGYYLEEVTLLGDVPVQDLIRRRYSCRSYEPQPIPEDCRLALSAYMAANATGPFGGEVRLALIAATQEDDSALRGLGTYGFIRGATGYIAGAIDTSRPMALEDFGYVLERVVLYATALALGTVWLGGTFTKSRFARSMALGHRESLPAVVATGLAADRPRRLDAVIRRGAGADRRLPWEALFFDGTPAEPLTRDGAGPYAEVLEMVRLAPSASNKQPWRIARAGDGWRLYVQRSRRYRARNALAGVADMQRIDMGIAMCHFDLTARAMGLAGGWAREEDAPAHILEDRAAYVASWRI